MMRGRVSRTRRALRQRLGQGREQRIGRGKGTGRGRETIKGKVL
jgi:hypothetical protein